MSNDISLLLRITLEISSVQNYGTPTPSPYRSVPSYLLGLSTLIFQTRFMVRPDQKLELQNTMTSIKTSDGR